MSYPLGGQDLIGNLVTNTDMGIPATVTTGATVAGTNVPHAAPQTNFLVVKLTSSSTSLVINVSVNSGTPNFGSPTVTKTISSGDTAEYAIPFNTTTSNLNWAVQVVDGGGGTVIAQLAVLDLGFKAANEDWVNLHSGANSYASTIVGSGSGVFSTAAV